MKILGKFVLIITLIFFVSSSIFSEDIQRTRTCSNLTRVKKQIYPNGQAEYFNELNIDYGTYMDEVTVLLGSIWDFWLPIDIPQDYVVKRVQLRYTCNSGNSFYMGYVADYSGNPTPEERWNLIVNSTLLDYFAGSTTSRTVNVSYLIEPLKSAHSSGASRAYLAFKDDYDGMPSTLTTFSSMELIITYGRQVNYTVKNNFNSGQIIVNSNTTDSGLPWSFAENSTNTFEAIEPQTSGDYNYRWNDTEAPSYKSDWILRDPFYNETPLGQNVSINHTAAYSENNSTITANLRKICNFAFSNQLPGTAETGEMKLNDVTYAAPVSAYPVVEQNEVDIEAKYNYDFGGDLFWRFNRWSDGGSSPSFYYTATQHKSFTAEYKRVPVFTEGRYRNLSLSFPGHGSLRLSWDEHPNTSVTQYQIWKQVYFINGVHQTTEPYLLATVNRGTTSYTDITVQQLPGEDQLDLGYDVKAYYQPDGTVSDPNFRQISAYTLGQQNKEIAGNNTESTVIEYSINNYPNPFNPSTKIDYSVKEDGFVSIRVYNLLGKEIAALVNETKSKGYYSAEFSVGSFGNAAALPSGVYIYTINVNDYFAAKKIILSK